MFGFGLRAFVAVHTLTLAAVGRGSGGGSGWRSRDFSGCGYAVRTLGVPLLGEGARTASVSRQSTRGYGGGSGHFTISPFGVSLQLLGARTASEFRATANVFCSCGWAV